MQHGERSTYVSGCRCFQCRRANAAYIAERRGRSSVSAEWSDTGGARAHIATLRAAGLGVPRIAKLAGLSVALVNRIAAGVQFRTRTENVEAILGVKASLAKGARVNGYRTRHLIRALRAEGFTKAELARRLGLRGRELGLDHRLITVRNALKVRRLFEIVTAE